MGCIGRYDEAACVWELLPGTWDAVGVRASDFGGHCVVATSGDQAIHFNEDSGGFTELCLCGSGEPLVCLAPDEIVARPWRSRPDGGTERWDGHRFVRARQAFRSAARGDVVVDPHGTAWALFGSAAVSADPGAPSVLAGRDRAALAVFGRSLIHVMRL